MWRLYLTTKDGFRGHFLSIFKIISVCFLVAIFDLVQDVEAIFDNVGWF